MHGVSCKARTLPDKTPRLGKQFRHFSADQLVAHGLLAVGIDLALVAHIPRPARCAVVIRRSQLRCAELCLLCVKRISVLVLCASHLAVSTRGVDHEDGVVRPVDVRVDAQAEKVLVIVCVDAGVHFCAPAFEVLAWKHGVGVQDACEFDLKLNRPVEMEDPVHAVLVVGGREDVRDDEFASSSDCHTVIAKVGVLEQDPRIFLVNADGILNRGSLSSTIDKRRIHVVNRTLAIAAQAQRVCHVSTSVLSKVKGVLALMRMIRVSVRYHHLRK